MSIFEEYATTCDAFLRLFLRNAFYIIGAFYTLSSNSTTNEVPFEVLLTHQSAVEIVQSSSKYALLTAMHLLRCECATRVVKEYIASEKLERSDSTSERSNKEEESNASPMLLVAQHVLDVLGYESSLVSAPTSVSAELYRIQSCMVAGMVEVFLREYGDGDSVGGSHSLPTAPLEAAEAPTPLLQTQRKKSNINDEVEERFLLAAALSVGPREHLVSAASSLASSPSCTHDSADRGKRSGEMIGKEDLIEREDSYCPAPAILLQVFPYLQFGAEEGRRSSKSSATARNTMHGNEHDLSQSQAVCRVDYGCTHYWGREVLPLLVLSMCMERKAIAFDQRRRLRGAWRAWLLKDEMRHLMKQAEKQYHDLNHLRDSRVNETENSEHSGLQQQPQLDHSIHPTWKPKEVHFSTAPLEKADLRTSINGSPPKRDGTVSDAAVLVLERVNAMRLQHRVFNVWKNHFTHTRVALRLLVANRELQSRQRCFAAWKQKLSASRKRCAARILRATQDKERLVWWNARTAAILKETVLRAWLEELRVRQLRRHFEEHLLKSAWSMWKRAHILNRAYNTEAAQHSAQDVSIIRVFPGSLKRLHARAATAVTSKDVRSNLIRSGAPLNCDESLYGEDRPVALKVFALPNLMDGPWKRFTFGTERIHVRCLQNVLSVCLTQWKRRRQECVAARIAQVKLVQRFHAHIQSRILSHHKCLTCAVTLRSRSLVSGCWKRWVHRAVVVRPLLRRVLAVHQRSVVLACWGKWKTKCTQRIAERQRVAEIRSSRFRTIARSAFQIWKKRARVSQSESQVCRMVCRTRLARCFRLWSLRSTVQRHYSRDRIALADLFLEQVCVKRAWSTWRHALASRFQLLEKEYEANMIAAAARFRRERTVSRLFSFWKGLWRFRCHHRGWSGSAGSSRCDPFTGTHSKSRDSTMMATNGSLSISVQPLPEAPFVRNVARRKHAIPVAGRHHVTRDSSKGTAVASAAGLNVSTQQADLLSRISPEATGISVASASVHSSTFSIPSFLQLRPHRQAARRLLFNNTVNHAPERSGETTATQFDASKRRQHVATTTTTTTRNSSVCSSTERALNLKNVTRSSNNNNRSQKSVYFVTSHKSLPFRDPNNLRNYEPYIYEGIHRNRGKLFVQLPSGGAQGRSLGAPANDFNIHARSSNSTTSSSSCSNNGQLGTHRKPFSTLQSAPASVSSVSLSPLTAVLPTQQHQQQQHLPEDVNDGSVQHSTYASDLLRSSSPPAAAVEDSTASSTLRSLSLSSISRPSSPVPHVFRRTSTPPLFSGVSWQQKQLESQGVALDSDGKDDLRSRSSDDPSRSVAQHQEGNRMERVDLAAPPPLGVIEVEMDAVDEVGREWRTGIRGREGSNKHEESLFSFGQARDATAKATPLRPTHRPMTAMEENPRGFAPVYPFGRNEEASPESYSPYSVDGTEYHPSP